MSLDVVDASEEGHGEGVRLNGPGDTGDPLRGNMSATISFVPDEADDTMDIDGDGGRIGDRRFWKEGLLIGLNWFGKAAAPKWLKVGEGGRSGGGGGGWLATAMPQSAGVPGTFGRSFGGGWGAVV